jgi:FdhD protein
MDLLAGRPPMRKATADVRPTVVRADGSMSSPRPDRAVTEEPMAIRLAGPQQDPVDIAVTMRTPGHDFELAVGFCWSEGLITRSASLRTVAYCDTMGDSEQRYNVVTVRVDHPVDARTRPFAATAACGVCGTESLDLLTRTVEPIDPTLGPWMAAEMLVQLPDRLRGAQQVFDSTGGLHAAGLFTASGELQLLREDVGRHNAVDKVIGRRIIDRRTPLDDAVLVVSGRTSYEIVQKAAMAGIGVLAAVSAPSSLAVEAAERVGMTLVGFVRNGTANIYTHPERITSRP